MDLNRKEQVEAAFIILTETNLDLNLYFANMTRLGLSEERASRLYNLILIACGREILSNKNKSPRFSKHYLIAKKQKIFFSSCPIYREILDFIRSADKNTIAILGVLSCELQAFNAALNEMQIKVGRSLNEKDVSIIEIHAPELPY